MKPQCQETICAPLQGIIYTIKGGDSQGCAKKTRRSFSIAIQCPPSGGTSGSAVFPTTITDLGNCAYATTMVHPSACPTLGKSTAGWGFGNWVFFLALGAFAVYFLGGMAFRYRQLGMRGIDMVPNLEFWRELPVRRPRPNARPEKVPQPRCRVACEPELSAEVERPPPSGRTC